MSTSDYVTIFSEEKLLQLFPPDRTNDFFEALYGDASEGAYDIRLVFDAYNPGKKELRFSFQLHERPGKCLACNLTYGLPEVFSRHPIINVKGLVENIAATIGEQVNDWQMGITHSVSKQLHTVPLTLQLA